MSPFPLPPRAIECRHLRRTIDSGRVDGPVVCLCEHPVRAGFDCIGPFIEDLPTDCGLWEAKNGAAGTSALAGN
jgi:hypothetical protein